ARTPGSAEKENFRTKQLGHLGRKDVKDAKRRSGREQRKPISGGSEEFVPDSPGQLEQMDAKDANRPVWPKRGTSALGQLGQRDAWDADSRRSRKPIKQRH
ncbi:hypothetical protein KI387_027125, partial [Taxus chinensis]